MITFPLLIIPPDISTGKIKRSSDRVMLLRIGDAIGC